jgi:hypothetical protein
MIIEQTYNLLKIRYKNQIEELTISDVRIEIYLAAVRLSDDLLGKSSNQLLIAVREKYVDEVRACLPGFSTEDLAEV